jgi:hypothetical protein
MHETRPVARLRGTIPTILPALALSGCSYRATTRFGYGPPPIVATPAAFTLAVPPFVDERPPRRYSSPGRLFLVYAPLIPRVSLPYERLEESVVYSQGRGGGPHGDEVEPFPHAVARTIADDLGASGIFRDVRFVEGEGALGDADLVLRGRLTSSAFEVWGTSYMLGIAGVYLWLLPIPVGGNAATMAATLSLQDRSGRELWRHALEGRARNWFTLYGRRARDESGYKVAVLRYGENDRGIDPESRWAWHAQALREAMMAVRGPLAEAVRALPPVAR